MDVVKRSGVITAKQIKTPINDTKEPQQTSYTIKLVPDMNSVFMEFPTPVKQLLLSREDAKELKKKLTKALGLLANTQKASSIESNKAK